MAKLSNIIPEYMNPRTMSGSADDIWLHYRGFAITNSCFRPSAGERLMIVEGEKKKAQKWSVQETAQNVPVLYATGREWPRLACKEGRCMTRTSKWNLTPDKLKLGQKELWCKAWENRLDHTAMANVDSAPADIFIFQGIHFTEQVAGSVEK